jgi:NAD(P)-dependent dehydrogenase (short-subunit alcohol dehydrogenase family)
MPVPVISTVLEEGLDAVPFLLPILKKLPWLAGLYVVKVYFSGASNGSERNMHGKVVMVTGGTSGVGEAVVKELAQRGAQIVLLTQHALSDPFIVDYIDDVRKETDNQLITAEQVDLESLHSVRTFATKWIDNAPPRRLDMIVLCANTITPTGGEIKSTMGEGIEVNWMVNYLASFHLLSILSPALRAQPPDRDVRILFGTCASYMGGDLLHITQQSPTKPSKKTASGKPASPSASHEPTKFSPANAHATSKLALTTFALAFQKHLSSYERPDKMPMNTKVLLVDPGLTRTPSTRRWLTFGSLFGLVVYLMLYPLVWLVVKSPTAGAQSFLFAAMEEQFTRVEGGLLIKECKERLFGRPEDVQDEDAQKKLWEYSKQMVLEAEKRGKEYRTKVKREEEERKDEHEAAEQVREYKEKVGKKEGQKKEGSRRSRKAGG